LDGFTFRRGKVFDRTVLRVDVAEEASRAEQAIRNQVLGTLKRIAENEASPT
jgi:hypothetical protein